MSTITIDIDQQIEAVNWEIDTLRIAIDDESKDSATKPIWIKAIKNLKAVLATLEAHKKGEGYKKLLADITDRLMESGPENEIDESITPAHRRLVDDLRSRIDLFNGDF